MIELKLATKTYTLGGEAIHALDHVSLKIDKGEFVAIVGPSGSGKSTLANVIGGLDQPDSGEVLIDEQSLATASDSELSAYRNKKVGFIFQSFNLQPTYTARENVEVPLMFAGLAGGKRRERAEACWKLVGLADRMNHKPGELSGGQRQRVCIARALANEPEIIIADEPTGNLDSSKSAEIIGLMKSLNKEAGLTLVVITHDPTVAKQAGRVISIQDGKLR